MLGNAREKRIEIVGAEHRAGGIIRVGQKNELRFLGQVPCDCFQVKLIVAHGNIQKASSGSANSDVIKWERSVGSDPTVAWN